MKSWVMFLILGQLTVLCYRLEDFLPSEKEVGLVTDNRFSLRKLQVVRTCQKYLDPHRVERFQFSHFYDDSTKHLGFAERLFIYSQPKLTLCVPSQLGQKAAKIFAESALSVFPKPKSKTPPKQEPRSQHKKSKSKMLAQLNNEPPNLYKDSKKRKKSTDSKSEFSGVDKVMFVVHPFVRLASSFLRLEQNTKEEISRMTKQPTLTFKGFVNFLTRPRETGVSDDDWETSLNVRSLWLPYHYDCQVCHRDLFPDMVIKVDEAFDEDVEAFLEDYGLEDMVDDSINNFVHSLNKVLQENLDQLMKLFHQLDRATLDSLVDFYHVDLEMFHYSAKPYYRFIS